MMVRMKMEDVHRIRKSNARMRCKNEVLRESLNALRAHPFAECLDVLDAMTAYCRKRYDDPRAFCQECVEHKAQMGQDKSENAVMSTQSNDGMVGRDGAVLPESNVIQGPGGGLCGGYTPGGANKLRSLQIRDKWCRSQDCPQATDELPGKLTKKGMAAPKATSKGPSRTGSTASVPEKSEGEQDRSREGTGPSSGGAGGNDGFRPSARILGEMAFQLDRRILDYVFGVDQKSRRHRFYGYTVSNICHMMEKESTCPGGGQDVIVRTELTCRLRKMLCAMEKYGYRIKIHADFAQEMVNKYGLLPSPPDKQTIELFGLNDPGAMSCLISRLCKRQSEVHNLNILLNCLTFLAHCDGRPLFVW